MVSTIAPWAEPVPGVERRVTADELLTWPEDPQHHWRYELIGGRLIRMVPPGFEHGEVTINFSSPLHQFVKARKLGVVTAAETGYLLSRPGEEDTVFAPDIAFVSAARLANQPPPGSQGRRRHLRVAPDFVVEVPSPDQYRPEMAAKAQQYLAAGVRLIWIIWTNRREVDEWRPGSDGPVATRKGTDLLKAEDILPGFSFQTTELFA
jgi:Uma2 family endonuclease